MITAREYTSADAAEMRANAAAIHARLMKPKKVVRALPAPDSVVTVVYLADQPDWKRRPIHFDAHVRAYQWHRANIVSKKVSAHIKRRCIEMAVDYDVVMSGCRSRDIVQARSVMMYEIRTEMKISFPEIGRAFGGRDHTTVLHAVNKIAAMRAGA